MIMTPLLLALLLGADDKPTPKLPLGKETTYITEPLDKDGYLDYEAALNDRLGKGITPEKNANVLIWKALGPRPEGGKGMPAEFFKCLGIDEPPEKGEYFVGLQVYMKDQLKIQETEFEAVLDQQTAATQRPWAARDYPHIAAWVKDNEKPLAIVVEASKRSDYFNPLFSHSAKNGSGPLMLARMSGVHSCRELASALVCRAMLRVQEGRCDEAWKDLLACHRLSRLVGRGATLIEATAGIAVDRLASDADLAYLERAELNSKELLQRRSDLQALPPLPPLADKMDLAERFMFLEFAQQVRRHGFGILQALRQGPEFQEPNEQDLKALEEIIDWGVVLRDGNSWYDRLVIAHRTKDRSERQTELNKIYREVRRMAALLVESAPGTKLFGD